MAERLATLERRIASVRQLSSVVTAMRGIAAARTAEAQGRLQGIADYAATIGQAISRVLALPGETAPAGETGGLRLVIAICAEQGFVGNFNHRVLERADVAAQDGDLLFLVGSRGFVPAEEMGQDIAWSAPMAGHADQLDTLANRLTDALFARVAKGGISEIALVHAVQQEESGIAIVERTLVPFDFSRFPLHHGETAPLTQIPPMELLRQLSEEYVFAEICEALTLSFAAENAERMRAMIAARSHVDARLEELAAAERIMRQSEITEEVIELAAGQLG